MEKEAPYDVARKKRKPSVRAISKLFGMPVMTTHLLMSTKGIKRIKIRQGLEISDWRMVVSRVGVWCKLSIEQREQIVAWVQSYPHVIFSPIARDTVLVNDPDNPGSLIFKSKLILQCSIAELHGDLYSPTMGLGNDLIDKDGKHLVSDIMFQGLLPPELCVMSNHYKTVCCCEICKGFNYLQSALNSFRVQLLAAMVKELQRMPEKTARQRNVQSISFSKKTMYKQQAFNGE